MGPDFSHQSSGRVLSLRCPVFFCTEIMLVASTAGKVMSTKVVSAHHLWAVVADVCMPPFIKLLPSWLHGKESTCQYRRHRFDPWVRKIPGRDHPMDRGAWRATVRRVTKSWTKLSHLALHQLQSLRLVSQPQLLWCLIHGIDRCLLFNLRFLLSE